jgi:hypothetical protein
VGDPCASCNEENIGEFVDCVKCYNNGPCKECSEAPDGTYVPKGKCTLHEDIWSFKECNHNVQDVFHYKVEGGDCTPTDCGHCPFGDNISILRDTNNEDHGKVKSDTYNIACYTDGQIKPIPIPPEKPRFKSYPAKSQMGTICHQCDPKNEEEWKTCVEQDCRQTARCVPPYVYGVDNNDCIYPCQTDGGDASTRVDNSYSAFEFDFRQLPGYNRGFCFRRLPDSSGKLCGDSCATPDPEYAKKFSDNYHYNVSSSCNSYDDHNDCFRGISNTLTAQTSNPSLPRYMYLRDVPWDPPHVTENRKGPVPVEGQVMQCWTQTPNTNWISFPVTGPTIHHPQPGYTPDHFCPGEIE